MTIVSAAVSISFAGDGISTVFAVPYQFFGPDEIAVYAIVGGVYTTLTRGINYNVTGGNGATGTVVALTAPAIGTTWAMRRRTARTQQVDYVDFDPFPAATTETALDRLTAQAQETDESINRAIRAPIGDIALATLPIASLRALKTLGFDSLGNPIASQTSSALVSSAMQPVVAAPSLLSARALLGADDGITNPRLYGAIGDGLTDDSAAIAAAIAATAAGGQVFFPPGTYRMASPQTINANITLTGVAGASIIRGTTLNMTMFSYTAGGLTSNRGGFSNLTFDGGANGITAISATLAYGMTTSGCLFTGVKYAIKAERCWMPTIADCVIRGNASRAAGGISLTNTTGGGNGLSALGYISNVLHDCSAAAGTAGAQVSPLVLISETENMQLTAVCAIGLDVVAPGTVTHIEILGLCQGIGLSQCSSVGASTGIQVQAAATGTSAPSFVNINGCQIDSFYSTGISVIGTVTAAINIVEINGGSITAPKNNAAVCIDLVHIGLAVKIIGVDFYQWLNFPAKSGIGIALTSANYVTISNCFFSQLSTAVIFLASSSLRNLVSNCTFVANTATITGSSGVGNKIVDNISDLSLATLTASLALPSLPASGTPYVNDTGYTLVVSIGGGTVSAITTLAGTAPMTQGQFVLPPGNTSFVVVTYTVAPTWAIGVLGA